MNNGEYWRKRSEIREARAYSNCLEATNGLVNAYRDTAANIRREINDFYNRFATENGMDYADAVKFLNREEALEWRTSVEGYIEEIRREKDPAVRERLMQEYDARAYGSRITRLESLNGSIDTELSKLYARANEQFRQLLGENYTDGYYQAIYDIQSRYGYSSAFATVNSKVVENALTYPWSGANFSDRLWKHKFELLNQLRETLTTGLIRGESVNFTICFTVAVIVKVLNDLSKAITDTVDLLSYMIFSIFNDQLLKKLLKHNCYYFQLNHLTLKCAVPEQQRGKQPPHQGRNQAK